MNIKKLALIGSLAALAGCSGTSDEAVYVVPQPTLVAPIVVQPPVVMPVVSPIYCYPRPVYYHHFGHRFHHFPHHPHHFRGRW